MQSIKLNKFDYFVITAIIFQIFGGLISGFIAPTRLIIVVLLPLIPIMLVKRKIDTSYLYEFIFLLIWLLYGFISIIWSYSPGDALYELEIMVFNFTAFFVLLAVMSESNYPEKSIVTGWTIFFLLTVPLAIIELLFDLHLPISNTFDNELMNYGDNLVVRRFASVTFFNLNSYNTMLCYAMPFIVSRLVVNSSLNKTIFNWIVLLIFSFIVIKNGSRATFINLVIALILYIRMSFKDSKNISYLIFLIVLLGIVFGVLFKDEFVLIISRLTSQGFIDLERSLLIVFGLTALSESYFMGVGAGNFKPIMDKVYQQFLTSPHNLLLEIVVQYGIIILIMFLIFIFRLYKFHNNSPSPQYKLLVSISLFTLPLTSIIDSGYLDSVYIWIYFASILYISRSNHTVEK